MEDNSREFREVHKWYKRNHVKRYYKPKIQYYGSDKYANIDGKRIKTDSNLFKTNFRVKYKIRGKLNAN